MKITLVKPDGSARDIKPANGKKLSLEELQHHVGGYVEMHRIAGGEMYFDEEGLMKRLPVNKEASLLFGQVVVGNALVLLKGKSK